jgi:hypothetical protein
VNIQDDRALTIMSLHDGALLPGAVALVEALRLLGCTCPVDDLVRHQGSHIERCKATAKDALIAQLEHD